MDFKLRRGIIKSTGVFSALLSESSADYFVTLEHAFQNPTGTQKFAPKLPDGTYTCRRGNHILHNGPIETFEVLKVPGHSGILFHRGNTEKDSDGCILVGLNIMGDEIHESTTAFNEFMKLQKDVNDFQLTVS